MVMSFGIWIATGQQTYPGTEEDIAFSHQHFKSDDYNTFTTQGT